MAGCCSVEGTLDGTEVMAIIQVRDGSFPDKDSGNKIAEKCSEPVVKLEVSFMEFGHGVGVGVGISRERRNQG